MKRFSTRFSRNTEPDPREAAGSRSRRGAGECGKGLGVCGLRGAVEPLEPESGDCLVLRRARIYTPLEAIEEGYLAVRGGRILELGREPATPLPGCAEEDLSGMVVGPGLVDTHIHGARGVDVMQGSRDSLLELSRILAQHGVTSFLPTSVTAPREDLHRVSRAVCEAVEAQARGVEGARILGLHMEGPYINPERAGAQNREHIRRPDPEEFLEIWGVCKGVRAATVAPEVEGALDLIRLLSSKGVVAQAGHSSASYEEALRGVYAGVSKATHLYNAMREIHHREPGIAVALLTSPGVFLELIADAIHVSSAMLRLTIGYAGAERIVLVSDAISAAGLGDGSYSLGGLRVRVERGVARLEESGAIAGSTVLLDGAFRNIASLGRGLGDVFTMSSTAPARSVGADAVERIGLLRPGYSADLVILTSSLEVAGTLVGGRVVFKRRGFFETI